MMVVGQVVFFLFIVLYPMISWEDVPVYTVRRTTGYIVIDGVLDDPDWKMAPAAGDFTFPAWERGEREQTAVKMLWDDRFLYVAFRCDDQHIWAEHFDTNSTTYKDDCVEIFWNPNPAAGDEYNMFEINCIGTLLSVYNNFDRSFSARESRIMPPHIGQHIDGTLNDDSDTDIGYTVEIAIRFDDYTALYDGSTPSEGDMWRVGLNRPEGGKTNPQKSQWSPSRPPDFSFHEPESFGKIIFSGEPAR